MQDKPTTMRDDLTPELKVAMKRLMDNFIIAIVKRNGGRMEFPIDELDAADSMLTLEVDRDGGLLTLTTTERN